MALVLDSVAFVTPNLTYDRANDTGDGIAIAKQPRDKLAQQFE